MATITELRPDPHLRRRRQIRFAHSSSYDRRKKPPGFDVAAALGLNLERFPTKDAMLGFLLQRWLSAAAQLVESRPDYVEALTRALRVMRDAERREDAIVLLRSSALVLVSSRNKRLG